MKGTLVLGGLIVIAAGYIFWPASKAEPTATTSSVATRSEVKRTSPGGAGQVHATATPSSRGPGMPLVAIAPVAPVSKGPLPTLNAPLKESIEQLDVRAKSGDSFAACRLASDLGRCHHRRLDQQEAADIGRKLEKAAPGGERHRVLTAKLEKLKRDIDSTSTLCDGVGDERIDRAWEYAVIAADTGHIGSMLRFAVFQTGLTYNGSVPDAEGMLTWRDRAPVYIQQALAAGDPRAFDAAARFHYQATSGVWVLPRDPVQALAYRYALRNSTFQPVASSTNDMLINQIQEQLTPDQITQAQVRGMELSKKLNHTPIDGDFKDGKAQLVSHRDSAYCNPS